MAGIVRHLASYRLLLICCAVGGPFLGGPNEPAATAVEIESAAVTAAPPPSPQPPSAGSSSPIIFDGWRRTVNGWERLSSVMHRPSINERIASQRQEEATNLLRGPLRWLGRIHPIRIAAAQLALICLIAFVALPRETQPGQVSKAVTSPSLDSARDMRMKSQQAESLRGPRARFPGGPQQEQLETVR